MAWRITTTTDGQHVGDVFKQLPEVGSVVTFPDGDVVGVQQVFHAGDGGSAIVCGTNYQMAFTKE